MRSERPSLVTLLRVLRSVLICPLRDRESFEADFEAGLVHHGEHIAHALVLLPNQKTRRLVERQHTGWAGVDAEFVLKGDCLDGVPFTRRAIIIKDELGDDEQRDAFCAHRSIWCSGEYKMDDVVREVMVTPRDEDLRSADLVAAIGKWDGLRSHCAHI